MLKYLRVFIFSSVVFVVTIGDVFAVSPETPSSALFRFTLQQPAQILYQQTLTVNDYIVALSQYKKVDNRWSAEKFLRLQGELQRTTIELPREYNEQEVFAYYQHQLPQQAELLFTCEQRRCGESNNWANDHFGIKQLYGLNQKQYYATYLLSVKNYRAAAGSATALLSPTLSPNDKLYVTIYTVRRGNKRIYTQLEIITVRDSI